MDDLAKLSQNLQYRGIEAAKDAARTEPWSNGGRAAAAAFSANCLTIAAHLREAAEREKAEKWKREAEEEEARVRELTRPFPIAEGIIAAPPPSREELDQIERDHNGGFTIAEEREQEAALSPPKATRAPAPARLRDELASIVIGYSLDGEGTAPQTVDRILDALIAKAEDDMEYVADHFLNGVKAGRL